MEIEQKEKVTVRLRDVKRGDCFEKYGEMYIKVTDGAVNLHTGNYYQDMLENQEVRAVTLKCIEV